LAWMAAREARATGWPWACFRIGSRLLCFLAVAAAALVVRAGVPDSDDSFRLAMHRGAIVFLVVSAALLGLAAVLHYRDDVKTSGPVTASLLTALRLVSYVALAFLFFFLPEAEAGSPVALSGKVWVGVLIPVLLLATVFVIWMYVRDARAVGPALAAFLGLLRLGV